jgi:hypothetical protein
MMKQRFVRYLLLFFLVFIAFLVASFSPGAEGQVAGLSFQKQPIMTPQSPPTPVICTDSEIIYPSIADQTFPIVDGRFIAWMTQGTTGQIQVYDLGPDEILHTLDDSFYDVVGASINKVFLDPISTIENRKLYWYKWNNDFTKNELFFCTLSDYSASNFCGTASVKIPIPSEEFSNPSVNGKHVAYSSIDAPPNYEDSTMYLFDMSTNTIIWSSREIDGVVEYENETPHLGEAHLTWYRKTLVGGYSQFTYPILEIPSLKVIVPNFVENANGVAGGVLIATHDGPNPILGEEFFRDVGYYNRTFVSNAPLYSDGKGVSNDYYIPSQYGVPVATLVSLSKNKDIFSTTVSISLTPSKSALFLYKNNMQYLQKFSSHPWSMVVLEDPYTSFFGDFSEFSMDESKIVYGTKSSTALPNQIVLRFCN